MGRYLMITRGVRPQFMRVESMIQAEDCRTCIVEENISSRSFATAHMDIVGANVYEAQKRRNTSSRAVLYFVR